MFDFGWSEIALIGIVALVLIGPKDLPVAIRAVTDAIKKMRRMAGELQGHVEDMLREADLKEAHDTFRDLRGGGLRDKMFRAIDSDGSLRRTINEKPLDRDILGLDKRPNTGLGRPEPHRPVSAATMTGEKLPRPSVVAAPAFMPPGASPPEVEPPPIETPVAPVSEPTKPAAAPAFVPPAAVETFEPESGRPDAA